MDQSTDAWFEALEAATAPRVVPPDGLSPVCPGESAEEPLVEITSSLAHVQSLLPQTLALVETASGVADWASGEGIAIDPELPQKLAGSGAGSFLCVRFTSPGGSALTPAMRVTAPKGLPVLPFSIARAGASDVRG
ncbi:MAG: hypothetical protein R3F14_28060 [Polyangiaceae bacterium]